MEPLGLQETQEYLLMTIHYGQSPTETTPAHNAERGGSDRYRFRHRHVDKEHALGGR